ncbi:MAG: hypothetical protein FJ278_19285 [Planctomycetes bacterium]|nr:hypothetical protein [Planctomycetota bacterium]
MALLGETIVEDAAVRAALKQAWVDSRPGVVGGHEQGGFVLRDPKSTWSVARWPQGRHNSILMPAHAKCRAGDDDIVATFHTHPNTGSAYLQEPSETNKRAVRDDPDLKGESYVGEFVISQAKVYLVAPTGHVAEVGDTESILGEGD